MSNRSAWMFAVVLGLVFVAGCGPEDAEDWESHLRTMKQLMVAGCPISSVDGDADGLDDGLENCLLQRHAPVIYLPWSLDPAKPANVDWYLARVHMRFHHDDCPDCAILALGSVTQTSLINRSHAEKDWICSHTSTIRYSYGNDWSENETFFLQPPDDTTHNGSTNPADWKVYGHVYKNALGGVNVQYWYFFPYNDGVSGFNHESDWEHVNVRLASDYSISGVHFAHHKSVSYYAKVDVQWYDATHPYVWVADGTHASYVSEQVCDSTIEEAGWGASSCETSSNYRWFTWAGGKGTQAGFQGGGVINVGEKTRPLNSQNFIKYNSRWGEIGSTSVTNGVRGPAFNGNWLRDT
jgi:hypothetical protein